MVRAATTGDSEAPACSVCIANYNGALMLRECLNSVLTQEGELDIEIIVHDDASTDASLDVLAEYPQIRVIHSTENVGFCVSNNRMAAVARGVHLLLLNNDAKLRPDALLTLFEASGSISQGGVLTLPQFDWDQPELVDRGNLLDPFYNPIPNLSKSRRDVAMVMGACLWLPRALWEELGGFPEWMGSVAEDTYLCCAARLRGRPVRVVNASGYHHRRGASLGGNRVNAGRLNTTYRRRYLSERNKTFVLAICTPGPAVIPLMLLHVCLLLVEGAILSLLTRQAGVFTKIYWPALRSVAVERNRILADRARMQRVRAVGTMRYFSVFLPLPRKLVMLFRYGLPSIK